MLGEFRRGTLLPVIVSIMIISPISMTSYVPDDPFWSEDDPPIPEQWAPQRISIPEAWDLTNEGNLTNPGSREIVIALIDHGVNYEHEDLEDMMWENPYDWFDGEDNDRNGLVDDVYGWNFFDNTSDVMDYGTTGPIVNGTTVYHGTMIAGIISAIINNNFGIAGIAQVSIMALKVFNGSDIDPSSQAYAKAINYSRVHGADIISMSFGSGTVLGLADYMVTQNITNASAEGIMMFGAAGNDRSVYYEDPPIDYPAAHPLVVAVGATNRTGILDEFGNKIHEGLSNYSNYNPHPDWEGQISLVAPGGCPEHYYAQLPPEYYDYENVTTLSVNDSINASYGTSLAVPHAVGTAALIMSLRPSMTNTEIWQMMNATCEDLPDPTGDDAPSHDDDFGFDRYSGWGLINASRAVSYSNLQKDTWSTHTIISNASAVSSPYTRNRQAMAIDSQGFTHIVWIDNRSMITEVYYTSVHPSGRNWTYETAIEAGHNCRNSNSRYPDIYIDHFDNAHISWLDGNEIYYTRLAVNGTKNLPPPNQSILKLTNSPTRDKECLNIFTDDLDPPSVYIVYNIDAVVGTDWDIAWTKVIDIGGTFQTLFSDTTIVDSSSNLRSVMADIGRFSSNEERFFLVYEDDIGNDLEIQWRQINMMGTTEHNRTLTENSDEDEDPFLDVEYRSAISAMVWRRESNDSDKLFYRAIKPNGEEATYGNKNIQIGIALVNNTKDFPSVAIATIQNQMPFPYDFINREVHIQWKEWDQAKGSYSILESRCQVDGRSFTVHNESIIQQEGYGFPLVISVDEKSLTAPSYIKDGHFRTTWLQKEAASGNYTIAYMTTNELWKGIRNVTSNSTIEKESDMAIDQNGDYHLAWTAEDVSSGRKEVCYANWINNNLYAAPSNFVNLTHNQSNTDSYRPKLTTIQDDFDGSIQVILIWVDEAINSNGDLFFARIDADSPTSFDISPIIVSCSSGDNNVEYDHQIETDYDNQWIAITWCEDHYGDRSLFVGAVGFGNEQIVEENIVTSSSVYECYDPSIAIDEQTWSLNIAYIRSYANGTYMRVHYTQIIIGASEYSVYFDVAITGQAYYRYPEIVIDHETLRLNNTQFKQIRGDYNRRDGFVHIIYNKVVNGSFPQRHAICYQKYVLNGTKVIDEKLLLPDDFWWVPIYRSHTYIECIPMLDDDNRLNIVYQAKVRRGNHWEIPSATTGAYFTKIDHNGEILTTEMFITKNETYDVSYISADIDADNQISVIWTENNDLRFTMNGIRTDI